MCRLQVEDGDVEVFHEVPARHQQAFAEAVRVASAAIAQASTAGSREVRVTSRGSSHIILQRSQGEGI